MNLHLSPCSLGRSLALFAAALLALPALADPVQLLVSRIGIDESAQEVLVERPGHRPLARAADGGPLLTTAGVRILPPVDADSEDRLLRGVTILVESVAESGDAPTPTDNDYTRISEAIAAVAAVGDGTIVRLVGTFDWTEMNAFDSWEAEGFGILGPTGVADVTIGAQSLGDAVILGPGDLPELYFEGFLFLFGGTYQGWTIENLDLRGFDWTLGLFHAQDGTGSTVDFNDVTIANNRIELPVDLNTNAAPDDNFQNIALHFAFGTNQTIQGNEFILPGTGVSDSGAPMPASAASVVMQSNTSGGAVFDGLQILDNVMRITGAQNADPERIYGIWENAAGHTSNITVSGNSFVNEDPGNMPFANFQRGFRVTSHSSMTSTVTYSNNRVEGANIGIHWIGDGYTSEPPATVEAVEVTGNVLLNNDTGVWVHSDNGNTNSKANVTFNRFFGNNVGLVVDDSEVTAENNWWGCNAGPGAMGCDNALFTGTGFMDTDPWLVLGLELAADSVIRGGMTTATASLRENSDGMDTTADGNVPDGTPVDFSATGGTMMPEDTATLAGLADSTYTAGDTAGSFDVSTTVDNETVTEPIDVTLEDIFTDGFESGDTSMWGRVVSDGMEQ
ncbi:MAG: hypothetical protein SX243_00925 [Acidobacteriota bacterium]|nr:hypothetical protein [Acidobacteriota bacterium]